MNNNKHKISIFKCFMKYRDIEDWSNDAENSALPLRNKLLFKIF